MAKNRIICKWNKFVKRVYHVMKHKNRKVSFMTAVKKAAIARKGILRILQKI
jgi:hypothetical protein